MVAAAGSPRLWGKILRETFHAWLERDAFTQSAALAFFALFSLAPVLVLFATGAGLLFDPNAVRQQIVGQFDLLMGHQQALAIDAVLAHAAFQMTGTLARIIGVATFVIATLAVFVQLQDSLNRMWDVAPKPGPLIRTLLLKRLISFALVLALGFVLVVSLVFSATIHALQNFAERFVDMSSAVFESGNAAVTYVLVTLLFAMLYRILPDVEIFLARRVAGSRRDVPPPGARQMGDRLLSRTQRSRFGLRNRRVDDRHSLLGLLRVAPGAARRGLHPGPIEALPRAPAPGGCRRAKGAGRREEAGAELRAAREGRRGYSALAALTAFANSGMILKRSPTTP